MRDLNLLTNVFRRKFEATLLPEDKFYLQDIFGNIADIHELTMKMQRALEDAKEMSSEQFCAGAGIYELAEGCEFDVYKLYVAHLSKGEYIAAINKVLATPKYSNVFEAESRAFASGSSAASFSSFSLAVKYVLPSLLLVPFLHFYKYLEHITNLLSLTSNEDDRTDLQREKSYLAMVKRTIDGLETPLMAKRWRKEHDARMDADSFPGMQLAIRMNLIEKRIADYKAPPIARTCRELIKEGDIEMIRTNRPNEKTTRYLFVFDHLIVFTKVHDTTLRYKDKVPIRTAEVHDLEATDLHPHAFRIEGFDKKTRDGADANPPRLFSYTLLCKSSEDKEAWMEAVVGIQSRSMLDRMLDSYLKEEKRRIPLIWPSIEQYIYAESDTDDNIAFEDYTSSSGIPVVKYATLIKLIERLTYHLCTDNAFVRTFLISYRSFCSPMRLLELLILRFEVPVPDKLKPPTSDMRGGPLAGRYDTVQSHGLSASPGYFNSVFLEQSYQRFRKEYEAPIQLKVLNVMRKWVSEHWYDFEADTELVTAMRSFLGTMADSTTRINNQHRKFGRNILQVMDKKKQHSGLFTPNEGRLNYGFDLDCDDETLMMRNAQAEKERRRREEQANFMPRKPEILWHTARPGDIDNYGLLTLHPIETARQLTLMHFDLYRAIRPIELVEAAWMKADKKTRSPQLLRLTHHASELSFWLCREICETESCEERTAMFIRILEIMAVFEELHNFTGLVAFYSALCKSAVHRMKWCWEGVGEECTELWKHFEHLNQPHWKEMTKKMAMINPPLIPFFGHYMTTIVFLDGGNKTFIELAEGATAPPPPAKEPLFHNMDEEEEEAKRSYRRKHDKSTERSKLVSFFKCRKIASIIQEIQLYQNQGYALEVEPTIKQFFENINPRAGLDLEDSEAFESYLYDKSLRLEPKGVTKGDRSDPKPRHSRLVLKSPGFKAKYEPDEEDLRREEEKRRKEEERHRRGADKVSLSSFAHSFGAGSFSHHTSVSSTGGNAYTSRKETGTKTAPPTPGYDNGEGRSPDGLARSMPKSDRRHHHEEPLGAFKLAEAPIRVAKEQAKSIIKSATTPRSNGVPSSLAPPPLLPRKATTKSPSTLRPPPSAPPVGGGFYTAIPSDSVLSPVPPPLHPRRATTSSVSHPSPPSSSRPSTSTTTAATEGHHTFVFPSPSSPPSSAAGPSVTPPALPPRRPLAAPSSAPALSPPSSSSDASPPANALRVTLDRPSLSPSSTEANSPSVSLSLPIPPPALPPRRLRDFSSLAPPLPPKRISAATSPSTEAAPSAPSSSPSVAPPLPPKTFKRRLNSSSPTNSAPPETASPDQSPE